MLLLEFCFNVNVAFGLVKRSSYCSLPAFPLLYWSSWKRSRDFDVTNARKMFSCLGMKMGSLCGISAFHDRRSAVACFVSLTIYQLLYRAYWIVDVWVDMVICYGKYASVFPAFWMLSVNSILCLDMYALSCEIISLSFSLHFCERSIGRCMLALSFMAYNFRQ